jgi:hypothetical protein
MIIYLIEIEAKLVFNNMNNAQIAVLHAYLLRRN